MRKEQIAITAKETTSILVLASIFISILILSNLTASKIASIAEHAFTVPIIFFPITYIISDVITEVYGFKLSRKIIWCGFMANLIIVLLLQVVLWMPPFENWHNQHNFEEVFGISWRIFAASMFAYIIGEYVNALMMAKMKISSHGKHLWYRVIGSSVVGELIDTAVFMLVAFAFIQPLKHIAELVLNEYIIRMVLEIAVLPITYKVVSYLKKKDNIDYYDYNTKFNIIS